MSEIRSSARVKVSIVRRHRDETLLMEHMGIWAVQGSPGKSAVTADQQQQPRSPAPVAKASVRLLSTCPSESSLSCAPR